MDSMPDDYGIKMWFCYETPGGDIYTPAPIPDGTGEKDEGIMESKVTLAAYNKELLQICMQKLEEELSKLENQSEEPFLCEFTITGYTTEDKKLIKTAGSNIAVNLLESLDQTQWEKEQK